MRLNTKTTLFSAGLTVVMILVLTLVSLASFRQFSIVAAQEHARTAAEIIRLDLTESMINGVIDKRKNFLMRLSEIDGLRSARVVRGPEVASQFGDGLLQERPQDDIERRVLASGAPYFAIVDEGDEPLFRATIPFVATSAGNPNCRQCHQVPENTVLGAVTLTTSIGHMKRDALITIVVMVIAVGAFALVTMLFFRRMTKPLVRTAGEVQDAVEQAIQGDFSSRIERRTNDEIGQIAEDINKLSGFLQEGLNGIRENVAQLLGSGGKSDGNLMTSTTTMVKGLIDVSHFKQAIEEDEAREEVYARLSRVLTERFGVEHFTIYEVASSKNRMVPYVVDGGERAECRWCDKQIMIRSSACRATRTGHDIDGIDNPFICTAFRPPEDGADGVGHICLPVIQSGTVGSVVQIVASRERAETLQDSLALIKAYVREAAPVIEAKRLMDTLRESNLRDAMTGLHNRRFLEEFVETLVATNDRRKAHLSVLMLDLDYFKKVNDTYGHNAGDTVLKELAKCISTTVRNSDLVIRYGGEEFMVILQDAAGGDGDAVAEKIRAAVEELKIRIPGGVLQKTISIGVADYPADAESFWQVIKFADVALYRAKELGRNRVVHFHPDMWQDDSDY